MFLLSVLKLGPIAPDEQQLNMGIWHPFFPAYCPFVSATVAIGRYSIATFDEREGERDLTGGSKGKGAARSRQRK